MKSLRQTARQAGVAASPLRVRGLAQRSGLPLAPSISLKQLMAWMETRPAGLAEEARFRRVVSTPPGTALVGFVDLTVRSDGTYKAQFHMRATGFPDYVFQTRGLFAASNGLVFAWQHSGRVEGTVSTTVTRGPRRDSDKVVEGFHPLIREHWPAVKAGSLAVSKEYSATGVTGFIQDLAKVVLDATAGVARGAAGVAIGLGDEMVKAFNSLELGGAFGVVGGVVVFASGGGLVLAVTTGAQVGAVTKALIKQRPLTAEEAALAAQVFGGSLPPANRIILTNLEGLGGRAFVMPGGGNTYVNIGAHAYDHPLTHLRNDKDAAGALFIHELTHVWQIHHATFVPGWVCSGLIAQAGNTFVESAYTYGAAGTPWSDFNIEQQGNIVDDWYGGTRFKGQKKMDPNDPYFRYIRDNIRAGRT